MTEQSANPIGKLPKWQQITIFVLAVLFGLGLINEGKTYYERHTAPTQPERLTFTASVQDMVDRYNNIAAQVDRSLLLPPANALGDGGRNEKFHVLRHEVKPNIYITIEVDNASGRPFSLNATAAPTSNDELLSLVSVLPTIGATVFGKGNKAGIIVNQCTSAIDEKDHQASVRVDEFEVFCASAMGLWMAGISVVNTESKLK